MFVFFKWFLIGFLRFLTVAAGRPSHLRDIKRPIIQNASSDAVIHSSNTWLWARLFAKKISEQHPGRIQIKPKQHKRKKQKQLENSNYIVPEVAGTISPMG